MNAWISARHHLARHLVVLALAAACGASLIACDSSTPTEGSQGVFTGGTFRVTLENLTTGQPISPGVIVTHAASAKVWRSGSALTEALIDIAEDGEPTAAVSELEAANGVYGVVAIPAPLHRIGGPGPVSQALDIEATASTDRLSILQMLICTNDAITGVDSLALPAGDEPVTVFAAAYDAGSEQNTEDFGDVPDPCQAVGPVMTAGDGNRDDQVPQDGGVVHSHAGIVGGADLDPAQHGWTDPVLMITVQRL